MYHVCSVCVRARVRVFRCVFVFWERPSEIYVFRYAFPSGKTFLCIYSIYIVSVSFLRITCKQPLGDLTAQVHLKDGAGDEGEGGAGSGVEG